MIEVAPQPQEALQAFENNEGTFRTPEEVMVTLLAQSVLSNFTPKEPTSHFPRPFEPSEGERLQENPNLSSPKNRGEGMQEKRSIHRGQGTNLPHIPPSKGEAHSPGEKLSLQNPQLPANTQATKTALPKEGRREETPRSPLSSKGEKTPLAKQKEAGTKNTRLPSTPHTAHKHFSPHQRGEQKTQQQRQTQHTPHQAHGKEERADLAQMRPKVDRDPEKRGKKRHLAIGKAEHANINPKVARVAQELFPPAVENDYQHFLKVMMHDSDLSEFFNARISHFDVLVLFLEVMKLEITSTQQERIARQDERQWQIEWMQRVVKEHKSQAKFLLFAGVGAGVLGVVSGALPIIGHMRGDWILNHLKTAFSSLENMQRQKAFDNVSKMAFQMAEMNKAMGQVQSSFCEGERSWADHKSNLHRTDGEENTRTLEEYNRELKTWSDVLAQILRMEQDLVRLLYQ